MEEPVKLTTTQQARLKAAGFAPVQVGKIVNGWVPASYADKVAYQVNAYRDAVEAILGEKRKPGRPRNAP
jgi:hypothetical protein